MALPRPWSKEKIDQEAAMLDQLWELYQATQRLSGLHLVSAVERLKVALQIPEGMIQLHTTMIALSRPSRNARASAIRSLARSYFLEQGTLISWHEDRRLIAQMKLRSGSLIELPDYERAIVMRINPDCRLVVKMDNGEIRRRILPGSIVRY